MTKVRKKIGNIPINTIKQDLQSTVDASVTKMQQDITDFIDEETAQYPEIGGAFKFQEDPEGRSEATTDKDGRIISYRKPDGTRVENVGLETPKANIGNLTLSSEGMNEFQQALKDSGFTPSGGDFSDKKIVEIPTPQRYAMLNLIINGMPTQNNVVKSGYAVYYDGLGNYFKKAIKIETQGQSSKSFAITGSRGNYTLDIDDGSEIKFGSWVPQDSFHLKGTPKDVTHGILATSYKWAYMFMEYLDAKPNRVLKKDDSKITITNASGDRFTDWIDDARCLPDGFPVEIYVDGEYWGLYAWQLKKHRKNYSMKKSDYTSLFIDADNLLDSDWQHGFWLDGVDSTPAGTTGKTWWNYFDIKGPKDLVCMDGSAFNGDNPKELIDSTSEYYDDSNKKHKGSAQAKAIIRGFSTKYLEVKTLIDNNDIEGAKAKFNENFDYNACMLVYIFNCLMGNGDSVKKNTLWGTYKNGKIAPMLWDIDGVYGTDWWGGTCYAPSASMWKGTYASAAWPLSFMWTLYKDEIKATYAELRNHGIIDMNTWKSIVFGWANQIGTEAFERDIERWSEMPSYRENYTNTEYWQEYGSSPAYSTYPTWDENTSYSVDDKVAIKIHPQVGWYLRYKAVKASDAQNPQPPVTKLYNDCPQVGGYYDSPKRMEKWMTEQIRLCDTALNYNE